MELISGNLTATIIVGTAILMISSLVLILVPHLGKKAMGLASIIGLVAIVGVAINVPKINEFFNNPTRTRTQASIDPMPLNIKVSEVLPTEFTVKWRTNGPVIGGLLYGTSTTSLDLAAAELDPSEKKMDHIARVTDLIPGTTYYFKVISGGKQYGDPQQLTATLPTE